MLDSKAKKNSLSIRLAESAVFLRSDHTHSRRNNTLSGTPSPDSLLRGLLVLDLAKPTRITNIEVQLTAVAAIYCPEGIGARRLEVVDQPHIFHTSTIVFRSSAPGSHPQRAMTGTSTPHRRSVSIGPGVSYTRRFDRDAVVSRVGLGEPSEISREDLDRTRHASATMKQSTPSPARLSSSSHDVSNSGRARRLSMDGNQSSPPAPPLLSLSLSTPPVPPYSLPSPDDDYLSDLLQRPSFTETILEDESETPSSDRAMNVTPSTETSRSSASRREYVSLQDSRPTNSTPSLDQQRGRLHSRTAAKRFSLSAVPSLLLSAVGSVSPRRGLFPPGNDTEPESSREASIGGSPASRIRGRPERGRATERRESIRDSTLEDRDSSIGRVMGKEDKERASVLAKILGEKDEWSQEFKPGTYTYPISLRIPSSAPPTLHVNYGSISWKLRAFAHRPGTFHSKLSAERNVIVVACPMEEDNEDSESIIIERNWEQQLQYLISISGRAFFIGGTIPISIVLMPMEKMKVHRITVYIEEKVEYFSRFHSLIRSDPHVQIPLLSLRNEGKNSIPILPLESSSTDVLRSSPLLELLDPEGKQDASKLGELAASFMGPGPWSFHKDLKLPNSCSLMKFSNKNLQAHVRIGHLLKVILRVEKAGIPSEAKPSLFDIVIQTPVLILSCRCNPEWATLPRYTEVFEDMVYDITPTCPCQARQKPPLLSGTSTEFSAPATGQSPIPLGPSVANGGDSRRPHSPHSEYTQSIVRSSSLFERLVSGQESETGEAPPSYDIFNGAADHGQSSVSVVVREVPLNLARRQKSGIFA